MKRLSTAAVVAFIVCLTSAASQAYVFRATLRSDGVYGYSAAIQFGDASDSLIHRPPPPTGYECMDAALPNDGQLLLRWLQSSPPQVSGLDMWPLVVWATPGFQLSIANLLLWNQVLGNDADLGRDVTGEMWAIYDSAFNVLWRGTVSAPGSDADPLAVVPVPLVKTTDPLNEGAIYYVGQYVPEPSTLVFLVSGLAGLAFSGSRRR